MNKNQKIAVASLTALVIAISFYLFHERRDSEMPSTRGTHEGAPYNSPATQEVSSNFERSIASKREIPTRYRFSGSAKIPTAENDQSLLAAYSPEEQAIVRNFYAAFGGTGLKGDNVFDNVFSFKNQRQLDWLATSGYPMPDEILMAAKTSTDELHSMAKAGNFKAKAILLVREYQLPVRSQSAPDAREVENQTQLTAFQQDLLIDGSPFGGYVWAAKSLRMPVSDGKAGVLAGYAFAETMGDERAALFASEFAQSNPGMNPAEALSSYRAMLGIASRNPQLANIQGLMKRPRFEMF